MGLTMSRRPLARRFDLPSNFGRSWDKRVARRLRPHLSSTGPHANCLHRQAPELQDWISRNICTVLVKHLVDLDEAALATTRIELGTTGIKDTVNAALAVVTDSQRADAWH